MVMIEIRYRGANVRIPKGLDFMVWKAVENVILRAKKVSMGYTYRPCLRPTPILHIHYDDGRGSIAVVEIGVCPEYWYMTIKSRNRELYGGYTSRYETYRLLDGEKIVRKIMEHIFNIVELGKYRRPVLV